MALPALSQAPVKIPFDADADFLKLNYQLNLGEVLGVAVNSKGTVVVLNHPGSATTGPLYGNATTQLLEFDSNGKFIRELGRGVYGLGYAHSVRFDKYDNLWVVDKGTHAAVKFNPAGIVTMNLGRRPEGPDEPEYFDNRKIAQNPPQHRDGLFNGPTDVAWDSDDNIYISDGYRNSRVAKMDKHGNWIMSWGSRGTADGQFNTPHNIAVDRQNNVYVADRGNGKIQVFDSTGHHLRNILQNAPSPARPAGDRGVHVHHVGPVAQRHAGFPDRGRALRDRQALPGQLGLGDLQRRRLQQPAVSRNDVTRRYRDDIAGDQLSGRDLRLLAVAPHPGRDDHHLLERGDGGLGLALLLQAENRVAQRQQDQQDAGSQLPEGEEAEDPGREQDDLHGVGVLPDEREPARLCPARGQLVGAEPAGPRRRFR